MLVYVARTDYTAVFLRRRSWSYKCDYFFKIHQWWEDRTMAEENL